jgi:hypothetical protein
MSDRPYILQYNVIARGSDGKMIEVCFHSMGRMGWPLLQQAQGIKEALEEADREAGNARTYEIIPVAVAPDFEEAPTFEIMDELDHLFVDMEKPEGKLN